MKTETFFLPREVNRINWSTSANIYNCYRSLFLRNQNQPVFVPIRSMQFMAILDKAEILFIDSQSYAVFKDTGGRMILLAWQYKTEMQRDTLDTPIPCEVIYYEQDNPDLLARLVVEFGRALNQLDERYRNELQDQKAFKILYL